MINKAGFFISKRFQKVTDLNHFNYNHAFKNRKDIDVLDQVCQLAMKELPGHDEVASQSAVLSVFASVKHPFS